MNDGMNDGKGKGRAVAIQDTTNLYSTDKELQDAPSLLRRVADSASGLARSTFAKPTGSELNDVTSAALASSGKSQSSRGNAGSTWDQNSETQPSSSKPQHDVASFKRSHADEHELNAESQFSNFLDGIGTFEPSAAGHSETYDIGVAKIDDYATTHEDGIGGRVLKQLPGYNSITEQENHDGEDVLAILSDPTATGDVFNAETAEEEAVQWHLTEDQVSTIRILMDEIFPPSASRNVPGIDHPLNLMPAMVTSDVYNSIPTQSSNSQALQMYFGEDLSSSSAKSLWISQWEGVLTRYTDEVWGDLMPLVQEASQEVEQLKEDPSGVPSEQPKALRRLGLVLGHLRGA